LPYFYRMQFSAKNRPVFRGALEENIFDILVIGGGITGAGIALDASARGLSVALIEKNDFGYGTSSRSTKLIHGGLRYLKQLEIGLVREVGQERAILHRNAPHIVIPEKMLLPIIKGGSLGKKSTSLGLFVYDRLAGVSRNERRIMLNKEEALRHEPMLRKDILLGGGVYIEYRTDDARLVIEVLKSAVEKGAIALNYCEATSFQYEEGKITGVSCRDHIEGNAFDIKARKVINAAGPWVDELRKIDNSLKGKRLHLTKGVHVVVSKNRFPIRQSVYFDIPADGRMMFAIPRGEVVYLGTTDTNYTASEEPPIATEADVAYILKATNFMFPVAELEPADVLSSWAGLRPLIHEDGKSPSELSRKDEIFLSDSGLISMAGGKLTGFRKMAERAVDSAVASLGKKMVKVITACTTAKMQLSGGATGDPAQYALSLHREYASLAEADIISLVLKYGSNTPQILDLHLSAGVSLIEAEWRYCADNEMICGAGDFIIRRSGRLYFDRAWIETHYRSLHTAITLYLGIDKLSADKLLQDLETDYQAVMAFEK